ncbi:MAG: Ubiquinol--cytochrome c reductase, cytochrome B subunit [Candidatus Jettenia ecosi]|uniref:Ubiquinol--cytochrome c reductase, cytochrome B subunit n=1 Tax=Candidatus Jettenia ecosi TaxID=2494326 RepID=A0A533QCV4_9BACT|nr:MAG: Ubiquinol--cytochrome c reductase, cytochrome B subunit [Candidatus Jettenia ecosi]
MANKIREWIEDRTGLNKFLKVALDEPVHGGAKWSYVFGSALVFLFVLQAVTGIVMASFYSPSSTSAWGSVYYIQEKTSFGWFVRGLHHYGSSAMIIVAIVHMFQVFIFGAYKKPRELNWISGVILLLFLMGFGLTGYLLPWDQKGYWATQVATNIIGTIPVIGDYIKVLHQGGSDYGNFTLTRFYALHVFLLPISLLFFLGIHIALFRKHGVTPYWKMKEDVLKNCVDPFWPDQVFKDIVFAMGIYAVLVGWVFWSGGAELHAPADPASNFLARPEWYFLFLFQLLKYCQGNLLIVGTVIIPTLAIIFLFVLPFIDRNPSRHPSKRIPFFSTVFSGLAGIVVLTVISIVHDNHDIHIIHQKEDAEQQSARAMKLADKGVPPGGGNLIFLNDPIYLGEKIFKESCIGCHMVKGQGGDTAPDFTDFGSREWVVGLLKDPKGAKYFKESGTMPPVKLPDESIFDMAEFLLSQSGELLNKNIDSIERGKGLVLKGNCAICHPIGDKDAKRIAPNLTDYLSETWLKEFIKNPSDPKFYGTKNKMPGFDRLTDKEMEALIHYLFTLSKDRTLISRNEISSQPKKRTYIFGLSFPRTMIDFKNNS